MAGPNDSIRRRFLLSRVQDNPGIHVSTVNPDIDGRSVSRLIEDLVRDGEITRSQDGRLHPARSRHRTRIRRRRP